MKVISFFSFKGGVGRTALLTNLGAYWASQGKVVLLMDLDLGAPGLSYSLEGKLLDEQGRRQGMSDLLHVFFDQVKQDPEKIRLLPPRYLIREVILEKPELKNAAGNLFFIPAGHRRFSIDLNAGSFDKDIIPTIPAYMPEKGEEPEQTASRALAYYLKEHLESWTVPEGRSKGKKIDYLLIDSRTGFAEILDLSLGYLADKMVLVASLNEQNLKGLKLTLEALKDKRVPFDYFPIMVTVVFSPLPASEDIQVYQRMEKAQEVIAQTLRFSRAGQRELAPISRSIHYNQILATQDALLILEHPESLYAKEVTAIARILGGEAGSDDFQDDLIRKTRRSAMKMIPTAKPEPTALPAEVKEPTRDNPFADLPPWYWPLPKEEQEEEKRYKILDELIAGNPNIHINREIFANLLCWSISLTIDEKKRIMESVPKLSQHQVDELQVIFEDERYKFMEMWTNKDYTREELLIIFLTHQREWAIAVLKDKEAGIRRFLTASDEHIFPTLEKWWKYWLLLARGILVDTGETGRALEMVDRAARAAGDNNAVSIRLLELIEPKSVPARVLIEVEEHAVKLAPSEPWLNYLMARSRLQEVPPGKEAAGELLEPLLKSPPDNARKCIDLAALVMDKLPEMAVKAEAAIRKAVELDPGYANAWYVLGKLLKNHLNRYEESEAAYRKAIELDEKDAYPWNGLGNLFQDHLNRYEESEAAYRKAIELDEKNAYAWNGLGLLKRDDLMDCSGAVDAFQKGIKVSKDNIAAYLKMNMGHIYLLLGDEDLARDYLAQALTEFDKQKNFDASVLGIAIELDDTEKIEKYLPAAGKKCRDKDFDSAGYLLLYAIIYKKEDIENYKKQALELISSFDDHFALLKSLYYLSGLRPGARLQASRLAAELLTLPDELTRRFKDQPKPGAWYDRYRPFAGGKSRGLGDPVDLHLFCKKKK